MIRLLDANADWPCAGQAVGTSRWIDVPQSRISEFGAVTDDLDPMHIDPTWAAQNSPYGVTIAFGFLTVSLLTRMINDVVARPSDEVSTLNYGFDRLRLISPVLVGARVRGHFTLNKLSLRAPTQYLVNYGVTVEIDGAPKPALVAEWLVITNVREPRTGIVSDQTAQ